MRRLWRPSSQFFVCKQLPRWRACYGFSWINYVLFAQYHKKSEEFTGWPSSSSRTQALDDCGPSSRTLGVSLGRGQNCDAQLVTSAGEPLDFPLSQPETSLLLDRSESSARPNRRLRFDSASRFTHQAVDKLPKLIADVGNGGLSKAGVN